MQKKITVILISLICFFPVNSGAETEVKDVRKS